MRIVRQQMLCIISAGWNRGAASLQSAPLHSDLSALFTDVGIVHFASIALLPPRPDSAEGTLPSLMLELAVDEGTRPRDLLSRLAHHPGGALWNLYCHFLPPKALSLPVGERNEELLGKLLADLSVADGGFVGPRDRTVAQVRQERELYREVRSHAARMPAAWKSARTLFASAMARWVLAKSRFDWAKESAPRSFWREQGGMAKFSYFGALISLGFLLTWVSAGVLGTLERWWGDHAIALPAGLYAFVGALLSTLETILREAVEIGIRLAIVLAVAAIAVVAYGLFFALLDRITSPWDRWFQALERELDRPSDTWSARVTHWFGWLVVVAVAIGLVAVSVYVLHPGLGWDAPQKEPHAGTLRTAWNWYRFASPAWLHALVWAYTGLFLSLLAVLAIGIRRAEESREDPNDGWLLSNLKVLRRRFQQPGEEDTPRAQQVHHLIEEGEAKLVAGIAHMVSLTELRWPYAWSAFWTRLSLRFVTAFGYVFFTEGRLGDAPGIQYSHWHIIDKGRRLLFCANFDGTFGGYLDDFIKGPSAGTTLFWRWTELQPRRPAVVGHPGIEKARAFAPTRLLVFRGVKCELKFKAFARESMLPQLFRFVAADLTLEEKNRATALRNALAGERTDPKDDVIMRTIES